MTILLQPLKVRSVPSYYRLIQHVILAAPLLFASRPARAQQDDEQLWLQINTNVPLGSKWRVTVEQIARFSDRQNGLFQTELGGIFGYRLSKHFELGAGYRWVAAYNGNTAANENRVRQHIIATFGGFTGRLRVDERFNPRGNEIGFRIRPLLRYNYRIGPNGWGLYASHESFWLPNSTSWGQRRGYERMRNMIGATVPVSRQISLDVGYLNQYRPSHRGSVAQMDHAMSLQMTINLAGHMASHPTSNTDD